jgi:hypothetical protein
MKQLRATRRECYALLESYQNRADHVSFAEEFREFTRQVARIIETCDRTVEVTAGRSRNKDFQLPPVSAYPDDRVLVIVTFSGRRLSLELLYELSCLVREHTPSYHIFIDGQVSHGMSFEIVFKPSGEVIGHETKGTDLLASLGFPERSSPSERGAG